MKPATGFMVGAALQILHVFSECATELGGYSPEIYDRGLFLSAAQGCPGGKGCSTLSGDGISFLPFLKFYY